MIMTTYTEPVLTGKVTSFDKFADICLRAFLYPVRELPFDQDVPVQFEPDNQWNHKRLIECESRLKELSSYTDEQWEKLADEQYELEISGKQSYLRECYEGNARRNAMLKQVQAWTPPTPMHDKFKEFMIEQLERVDQGDGKGYKVERRPPDDFKVKYLKQVVDDIDYYTKQITKQLNVTAQNNEWLRQLRESLPKR